MALTYTPIATTTLTGSTSNVTFSSIPSTYTDLILVYNGQVDANVGLVTQVNGDTGANYSTNYVRGNGSATSGGTVTGQNWFNWAINMSNSGTSIYTTQIWHFQNYANTNINKTVLTRASNSANQIGVTVGLWRNTAAINSINTNTAGNNFLSGTTFTLYGILSA